MGGMTRSRLVAGLMVCLVSCLLAACGHAADVATGRSGPAGAVPTLTDGGGVVVTARDLDPAGSFPEQATAVAVYVEPLCPHCKAFAADQGRLLQARLAEGAITLEYRLVSFLDNGSTDRASARSVNAGLCVAAVEGAAEYAAFVAALLEHQRPGGLSDTDLVGLADEVGAADARSCIESGQHADLVPELTEDAMGRIDGTPAVEVDGTMLESTPTTAELTALLGRTTV